MIAQEEELLKLMHMSFFCAIRAKLENCVEKIMSLEESHQAELMFLIQSFDDESVKILQNKI